MSEKAPEDRGKHHGHGSAKGGHGGSHEEHEGAPEWLISFADNVTLMMGFFVILLAMNMRPARGGEAVAAEGPPPDQVTATAGGAGDVPGDLLDFAIAVRSAFNNPVDLSSTEAIDQPLVRRIVARQGQAQADQPGPEGYEHEIKSLRPSDYYGLGGAVPFEHGTSTLTAGAVEAIEAISEQLRGHRLIVEVRGHVNAAECVNGEPSGMRLSFERSLAVAGALNERGVDWRQMRLIACGYTDPLVVPAYDEEGGSIHRRVEVVTTNEVMEGR